MHGKREGKGDERHGPVGLPRHPMAHSKWKSLRLQLLKGGGGQGTLPYGVVRCHRSGKGGGKGTKAATSPSFHFFVGGGPPTTIPPSSHFFFFSSSSIFFSAVHLGMRIK